jgi:hypothetical protein
MVFDDIIKENAKQHEEFNPFWETIEPPPYHSIRARVSELVKVGFLTHDSARPRNYTLHNA